MFDYDPIGDVPGLRQVLAANPSMPTKGRRYLTDFIESVDAGERGERRPLFAELWTTADQADAWVAEKRQTDVATQAQVKVAATKASL